MLLGTSMTCEASSGLHGKPGSLGLPETQLIPSWRLQTKHFPTSGMDGLPCTAVNQDTVHEGIAYALCYGDSINHYRQTACTLPCTPACPTVNQNSLYRAQVWRHNYWEFQVSHREYWTKCRTPLTESLYLEPAEQLLPCGSARRPMIFANTVCMGSPLYKNAWEGSGVQEALYSEGTASSERLKGEQNSN